VLDIGEKIMQVLWCEIIVFYILSLYLQLDKISLF